MSIKNKERKISLNSLIDIIFPVVSVILSLIIGMFIIWAANKSPIEAYKRCF